MSRAPVEVLWCHNESSKKHKRVNGWSFPPTVDRHLRKLLADKRVLHLFGGLAKWGTRLDIDPTTRPHVLGDAWLPPFRKDSFDVVVLDPPYESVHLREMRQLLDPAAFVAREQVLWLHTMWIDSIGPLRLEHSWLIRVGNRRVIRCLQVFRVAEVKRRPEMWFTNGPATRYNRWLTGQRGLFEARS